ncbi:hypothetical protein C7415_115112 [Cupriavidus alkaliphilus]|nr:hypothetical protein [Cupriavidus alkaliphilus]MBB3016841.1 hypothetical protein [Cupriavidus alkaliphilus]RAS01342.1 hypothetical protein C7415_115112 [Cupriavidus alkaliphilus]
MRMHRVRKMQPRTDWRGALYETKPGVEGLVRDET